MRYIIGYVFFLLTFFANAQNFDWAVYSGNSYTEVLSSVADKKGNITMAIKWTNSVTGHTDARMYDAQGNSSDIFYGTWSLGVVQYSVGGKLNWQKSIHFYRGVNPKEVRLAIDAREDIILFLNSYEHFEVDDPAFDTLFNTMSFPNENATIYGPPEGYTGTAWVYKMYEKQAWWKGNSCLRFGANGDLKDMVHVAGKDYDLEGFTPLAGGGFAFTGYLSEGRGVDMTENTVVFKTDSAFKIEWQQDLKREGSRLYPDVQIAADENENIYISGCVRGRLTFPDGKVTALSDESKTNTWQAYLTSFSKTGKLLWYKVSEKKCSINILYAYKNTLYAGGFASEKNNFSDAIDTVLYKKEFITAFDHKGNIRWTTATSGDGNMGLVVSATGTLYVASSYGSIYQTRHELPFYYSNYAFENGRGGGLVYTAYNTQGHITCIKEYSGILVADHRFEYRNIHVDNSGNVFITGTASMSLGKFNLSYVDSAFVKAQIDGNMAFCVKLRDGHCLPETIETNHVVIVSQDSEVVKAGTQMQLLPEKIQNQLGEIHGVQPWALKIMPNPFSAYTTIKVSASTDDEAVQLIIYDMHGRKIATLLNNTSLITGEHFYTFDAIQNNIEPGTYLVVLINSTTRIVERMVYQ